MVTCNITKLRVTSYQKKEPLELEEKKRRSKSNFLSSKLPFNFFISRQLKCLPLKLEIQQVKKFKIPYKSKSSCYRYKKINNELKEKIHTISKLPWFFSQNQWDYIYISKWLKLHIYVALTFPCVHFGVIQRLPKQKI